MKRALITGITGQDGSYLAEFLLERGYEVHGIIRRTSQFSSSRIDHILSKLTLHYGDLVDSANILTIILKVAPDEVYNLAAQSHVRVSFDVPEYTSDVDAIGALRILEAIRIAGLAPTTRFYQASTSEMFGKASESPQTETTLLQPRSPYGIAKLFAHWTVINYREAYNIFGVSGILFNHESPRRGGTFVTMKVINGIVDMLRGKGNRIILGNLSSKRDWGHAQDYVRAMWLMLQQPNAEDFVICTGHQISVREFVTRAFRYVGMHIAWSGEGLSEVATYKNDVLISVDPRYFRPTEVDSLIGCADKAKARLGWEPLHTVDSLIKDMMDIQLAKYGLKIP